ncbi:MAG: FmdB family zinc ribbon protein [Bryobacteraceae bacterium]|jgi:putative FmdB family regulatory protein
MPLYEYCCDGCGKTFELIQKFSDEPLTVHGECGGEVHRLLSAPTLQFKGTGWYVTDYARGNSSGPNGGNGHKDGRAEPKSENKSETKSEPKSETKSEKSETKPAT